jgi:CTP:molybdopterin cytidylyltransferase MocA
VLAAGGGSRFGGTKQLAPLRGRPLLSYALAAVALLDPRVVVLGHEAEAILAALDLAGTRPVICERWRDGQSASLRVGLEALGDIDAAVAGAAEPGLAAARGSYGGRPGHPVLLGRPLLARVGELRGDVGFRDLLSGEDVREIEVGGLADPVDIDTQEELARL